MRKLFLVFIFLFVVFFCVDEKAIAQNAANAENEATIGQRLDKSIDIVQEEYQKLMNELKAKKEELQSIDWNSIYDEQTAAMKKEMGKLHDKMSRIEEILKEDTDKAEDLKK